MREKIIKILRKMACDVTGKSLTAIGEEESIEVADAILEVVVAECVPERKLWTLAMLNGANTSEEEQGEIAGWNACRDAMIKKLGGKE